MSSSQSVIVTGATSMVGINCVVACLKMGMNVTALVRPSSSRIYRLPKDPRLVVVECEMEQYGDVQLPGKKYDVCYHFAWGATSHKARLLPAEQTKNVFYAISAVKMAAQHGCRRFVGAGSQAEYGLAHGPLGPASPCEPVSAYGVAKEAARRLCKIECDRNGLEFCWGRIFSVYGPYDNSETLISSLLEKLEKGQQMDLSGCEQIWDYLYSEDCGRAMAMIGTLGKPGAIYCVGSGKGYPLKRYVETIGTIYGTDLSHWMGRLSLGESQMQYLQADISTLQSDTGFFPEIDFEQGIRRTIRFMRRQQK